MSRPLDRLTLRTLAPRDRRAILLGLSVLLPALLYVAAVRPWRTALDGVRDRAAAERALLQREEALLAGQGALNGSVESLQTRAERAAQRLVHAPNVPLAEAELTALLETVASLSRVLLQEMRGVQPSRAAADESAESTLQPLRLAVRGESDLEGVLTFVQRIESGPILLRIAELSIQPTDDGRGGVVQFTLVVEAYAPAAEAAS